MPLRSVVGLPTIRIGIVYLSSNHSWLHDDSILDASLCVPLREVCRGTRRSILLPAGGGELITGSLSSGDQGGRGAREATVPDRLTGDHCGGSGRTEHDHFLVVSSGKGVEGLRMLRRACSYPRSLQRWNSLQHRVAFPASEGCLAIERCLVASDEDSKGAFGRPSLRL